MGGERGEDEWRERGGWEEREGRMRKEGGEDARSGMRGGGERGREDGEL